MAKAIMLDAFGGTENMRVADVDLQDALALFPELSGDLVRFRAWLRDGLR